MRLSTADAIKVAAVVTATPRWVTALLASEGFAIPAAWLHWWVPLSAAMSAAMAITEGFAFALIFEQWRAEANPSRARRVLALSVCALATFVATLAPQLFASVRAVSLSVALSGDAALWLWSACVAASTVMIVASVGYAQRTDAPIAEKLHSEAINKQSNARNHSVRIDRRTRCKQLQGEGLSKAAIARELQVNASTVHRWLRER